MQTKTALTVAQLLGKVGFWGMACAVSARPNLMNDKCHGRQHYDNDNSQGKPRDFG
jgi:hypothetical protein